MKSCSFLILFCFNILAFVDNSNAQSITQDGKAIQLNMDIYPFVHVMPLAGDLAFVTGLAGNVTLNDKYFLGAFLSKKVNKTVYNEPGLLGANLSYETACLTFGGMIRLGVKQLKDGSFEKRKTALFLALNGGIGKVAMVDPETKTNLQRDLILIVQPNIGLRIPLTTGFHIAFGVLYNQPIMANKKLKLNNPGAFLNLHIVLFSKDKGAIIEINKDR